MHALLDPLRELDLLGARQQRHLPDLAEVHADRIGRTDARLTVLGARTGTGLACGSDARQRRAHHRLVGLVRRPLGQGVDDRVGGIRRLETGFGHRIQVGAHTVRSTRKLGAANLETIHAEHVVVTLVRIDLGLDADAVVRLEVRRHLVDGFVGQLEPRCCHLGPDLVDGEHAAVVQPAVDEQLDLRRVNAGDERQVGPFGRVHHDLR